MTKRLIFFVPACGLGLRVKPLGVKPFISVNGRLALDVVLNQCPDGVPMEVALRQDMGCPPLEYPATVRWFQPTTGQADTIRQWVERYGREYEHVLISNCDNAIDAETIRVIVAHAPFWGDGVVFTFKPKNKGDERFSYVETDKRRQITRIAEKQAISNEACAGVYLLKVASLLEHLRSDDEYLSAALARMPTLYAMQAQSYMGWNDMAQIAELYQGEAQCQ